VTAVTVGACVVRPSCFPRSVSTEDRRIPSAARRQSRALEYPVGEWRLADVYL
jgi:hypothetical protein